MTSKTYLALGDSYTIGEQVPFSENYPNLTVQLLRNAGHAFSAPEIVAKTGWTTDELETGMNKHTFLPAYDFVSLLVGVNNQYRGRSAGEYAVQFKALLIKAVQLAGNNPANVLVLSIPDWSVTPFAARADRENIKTEIDRFNQVNREIASENGIHYIYITGWTREAESDPDLLAPDGLHPSGKEYQRWARVIADFFMGKTP